MRMNTDMSLEALNESNYFRFGSHSYSSICRLAIPIIINVFCLDPFHISYSVYELPAPTIRGYSLGNGSRELLGGSAAKHPGIEKRLENFRDFGFIFSSFVFLAFSSSPFFLSSLLSPFSLQTYRCSGSSSLGSLIFF